MVAQTLIVAASALVGAALVSAQAAPNWQYVPTACASDCAQTVEVAYLCENQYSGDTTNIYGCFCNAYPSDSSTCATCLNNNNAAALGALLTSTQTACPAAIKACFFACSFDTCSSSDIACQCDATYLENIYQCGSCNTANSNAGATQLTDWQALDDSCKNQNYSGATQSFSTTPLASPTGQAGYVAPTLTATGGGEAATGVFTLTTGSASAAASGSATSKSGSASASKASASGASSASASAAASSGAALPGSAAPAVGGVLAFIGAVVAIL